MKRLLPLLAAMLMLSGCFFALPRQNPGATIPKPTDTPAAAPTAAPTTVPAPTETTAPALPALTVKFVNEFTDGFEFAQIYAEDSQGTVVWSTRIGPYEFSQMDRIHPVGQWQQQYYFVDDGDLVCLDVHSGQERWRNEDFSGSPAGPDACCITEDGTVYLCGFFGPDFFAADAQGNTVAKVGQLDLNYYWAYKLTVEDGQVRVYMSGGPEGDLGQEGHPITVPMG